jgi:hypothetical protein
MGAVYCIFDGDNDRYAYSFMKGWAALDSVDFTFHDAHDLDSMTGLAQNEAYVKRQLRSRMNQSTVVVVLLGEKTKNLFKFVRWEIELAIELDIPIIVVNLNDKRTFDADRCPPILRNHCAIHIGHKKNIMKYAIEKWPQGYAGLSNEEKSNGWRFYNSQTYTSLGL